MSLAVNMRRRDFLKYAGVSVASLGLPLLPATRLYAAHDGYTGPLWLTIDANGGWDPTSFFDPKGYAAPGDPARINNYPAAAIEQIGNFRVAPPPDSFLTDTTLYRARDFITRYASRLLLINGIDCKTGSHSDGRRNTWSGELARTGYPSFGALAAAAKAPGRPMAFISNGGYSLGVDPVAPVRLVPRNLDVVLEIAYPNRVNVSDAAAGLYLDEAAGGALDLVRAARTARLQAARDVQFLPSVRQAMDQFKAVHADSGHLREFAGNLEARAELPLSAFNDRTRAWNVYRQGRIALAGYESGVTAAAHISLPGFDTHSNHDAQHYPLLMDFLQGLDGILAEAAARNLTDRIVVVVGSDFGRTNKYNNDAGKDHWPITSMMFIGNATQVIRGNRIIGATTPDFRAVALNPATLLPTATGGERLRMSHVHRSLRELAGITNSTVAQPFGLADTTLNLFA